MTENIDDESIKCGKSYSKNKIDYIPYPKAIRLLYERLDSDPSPEEMAAWVFLGPELGGLAAYLNANELKDPPEFSYSIYSLTKKTDYVAPLMACWFKKDDISNFVPNERFVTGKALIKRWKKLPNIQSEDFIQAKIHESRLLDFHLITGHTQWTTDESYPSKETSLFALSDIEKIEEEDFYKDVIPDIEDQVNKSFDLGRLTGWHKKRIDNNKDTETDKQTKKPWLIHCPNDPEPVQPWYTPARYFARRLVEDDSTLLVKRNLIALKVAASLKNAGINKRGGKKPLNPATVLKAFSNVNFG